jgi:hypothetical protein
MAVALDDELDPKRQLLDKLTAPTGPGVSGLTPPGGAGIAPGEPNPSGAPASGGTLPTPSPTGEPPVSPIAPPTDYRKLGKYAGNMGAWSQDVSKPSEKFGRNWDDMSERYQMMSVLSNFDPKAGITPEVVDALNKAGIKGGAKFSGSGDKLNVENLGGYDRFGTGGIGDIVKGLKGQNADTAWNPWSGPDAGGGESQTMPQGGGMGMPQLGGGVPLDSLLTSGDPSEAIQRALASMVGGERSNAQALLQRLMGGQR